jgi:lipoate---protein ligase
MVDWSSMADVEQFRGLTRRHAVVHRVDHPTVVLGSTQREDVLNPGAVQAAGAEVVRRRGGGGAVLLHPGDHLWVDAWIPRDDPLWRVDVTEAAHWAGEWWRDALAAAGVGGAGGISVHRGGADPGPFGRAVCFSGRGPGEVFHGGAKVMGLSQWRSREGALFHTCAYTRWQAAPLVALLELDGPTRSTWIEGLASSAVGLVDLIGPGAGAGAGSVAESAQAAVAQGLLSTFPHWGSAAPQPTA